MSLSTVNLIVMIALVVVVALAILYGELAPWLRSFASRWWHWTQTGDTSLSRRSIHWLAFTALGGALLICAVIT